VIFRVAASADLVDQSADGGGPGQRAAQDPQRAPLRAARASDLPRQLRRGDPIEEPALPASTRIAPEATSRP